MTNPDRWATPRIREAMAQLEEAEVGLDQRIADAKQLQRQVPSSGLSHQDSDHDYEHIRRMTGRFGAENYFNSGVYHLFQNRIVS